MTRTAYDSIDPDQIPPDAQVILYYVDGIFGPAHAQFGQPGWDAAALARFPSALRVGIAVNPFTDDGLIGDCENGDMTPSTLVAWTLVRRAAGVWPTAYFSISQWDAVRTAFTSRGIVEPPYLVAEWDNSAIIPSGAIGKQYANPTFTGRNLDISIIADHWPGVDSSVLTVSSSGGTMLRIPGPINNYWHLFGIRDDGQLYRVSTPLTGGGIGAVEGWLSGPGNGPVVHGSPGAALVPGTLCGGRGQDGLGNDRVEVFAQTADGTVWVFAVNDSGTEVLPWQKLGTSFAIPVAGISGPHSHSFTASGTTSSSTA